MSTEALYWVASVFLWLFFTGIGIPPVPEEAGILYAAGVTALHPEVPWWLAWPAASLGIIAADVMLYGIGRWLGPRVFQYRWVNRMLSPERRQRLEAQFHDHGVKFLLLSRLLPPLRTGVFLVAGSIRYPLAKFLMADAAYGIIGVGFIFFGGTALLEAAHQLGGWIVLGVALTITAYALYRYYRYLKTAELKAAIKMLAAVAPAALDEPAEKAAKEGSLSEQSPTPPG